MFYRLPRFGAALMLSLFLFSATPTYAWHFHGGPVQDIVNENLESQILEQVKQIQNKTKNIRDYTDRIAAYAIDSRLLLAAKLMSLFGLDKKLNNSGLMKGIEKYSNAFQSFVGKTSMDLDVVPKSHLELLQEMGQYDLRTFQGLKDFSLHLAQEKKLINEEALYLLQANNANAQVKQNVMDQIKKMKTSSTQTMSDGRQVESGSATALIQQNNMLEGMSGLYDVDQMQSEITMKTHKLEMDRLKKMEESADRIHGSIANFDGCLDPYHLTPEQQETWNKANKCDIDMSFDGKKRSKKGS